jgi:hypothetical protein
MDRPEAVMVRLLPAVLALTAAGGCLPEPLPPDDDVISGVEPLGPDRGFSLRIPPFAVPPGVEVQDCYFFAFPDLRGDGRPVWIDRFTMGQRTGSHHMNVFRVNTIVNLDGRDGDVVQGGECRVSSNWADWPLVVNSQESAPGRPAVDWVLPEGVAQKFTPGEMLMVQSHYVNADLQTTPDGGEVRINFHLSAHDEPIEMGSLFATQQSIRICRSRPEPRFEGACALSSSAPDQTFHVAAMNGHFHGRGTRFRMYPWDGSIERPAEHTLMYESTSWDEPPMVLGVDVVVPHNGGVWWTCDYRWQAPADGCAEVDARDPEKAGDCCYTFGNSAEHSEHCNAFVYYWPKTENIFCN